MNINQTRFSHVSAGELKEIFSMFDKNSDGMLQYSEFLDMANLCSLEPHDIEIVRNRHYPTKSENIPQDDFHEIFHKLFSGDGKPTLQHAEFMKICNHLGLDNRWMWKQEKTYFHDKKSPWMKKDIMHL
eukprot:UN25953